MGTKRTPLGKKLRFEVFKRDSFSCCYCGNAPPSVTLEVDHITPVSHGGTNEIDNLITACFSCNRGKGATPLSLAPDSVEKKRALLVEREEQLAGYQELVAQKVARLDREASDVLDIWYERAYGRLPDDAIRSVRNFIDKLGVFDVSDFMHMAIDRRGRSQNSWRYFCGICWNKIREIS